jgi:hypothetical protein
MCIYRDVRSYVYGYLCLYCVSKKRYIWKNEVLKKATGEWDLL